MNHYSFVKCARLRLHVLGTGDVLSDDLLVEVGARALDGLLQCALAPLQRLLLLSRRRTIICMQYYALCVAQRTCDFH